MLAVGRNMLDDFVGDGVTLLFLNDKNYWMDFLYIRQVGLPGPSEENCFRVRLILKAQLI